jgi:uncharacterized ion transporter superfamily protein YfcC
MRKIPHTYVLIFYIIIIAAVMTWIIPGGEYVSRTVISDSGEEITETVYETEITDGVVKEVPKFEFVESQPQTWEIFAALFKGFEEQAGIIVFILLVGGAFWIMNATRAIDIGIYSFLNFTEKLEKVRALKFIGVNNIIIVLIMLMFSLFGAIFGMSEETIAFIIILVPLAISMGYDSITGVAMVFFAAGLGFAGAMLNPFTIGIAQGIAELPLFSGIEYRMFAWLVINVVGISFVLWYANRIKKDPKKSPVYKEDDYWRSKKETQDMGVKYYTPKSAWYVFIFLALALGIFAYIEPVTEMTVGNSSFTAPMLPVTLGLFIISGIFSLRKSVHFFNLNLLGFTVIYLIIGVMGYAWYIMEIATLFFAMGIFAGIAMNYNPDKITKLFIEGTKDIMTAAMVVGLAGGIIVILQEGKVIDTILYYMAGAMEGIGKVATIGSMYVIQTVINILIPSGSAKAAITMPIMAPFSDYIGLSRQATVMAFQLGDGFTNMITPTSGVLIGVLGVAKIPYDKWVKWITPIMIVFVILGFLLLIPTVLMDLNGF